MQVRIQARVDAVALALLDVVGLYLRGQRIDLRDRAIDLIADVSGDARKGRRGLLEARSQILRLSQNILPRRGGIGIGAPRGKTLEHAVQRGDNPGLTGDVENRLDST